MSAEVQTLATVGGGVLTIQAVVDFKLYQTKRSRFEVALPKELSVLDVQGSGLSESRDRSIQRWISGFAAGAPSIQA